MDFIEKYDQIADKIDDCKKRNAIGDLSVIAYSLLGQLIHIEIKQEEANNA